MTIKRAKKALILSQVIAFVSRYESRVGLQGCMVLIHELLSVFEYFGLLLQNLNNNNNNLFLNKVY